MTQRALTGWGGTEMITIEVAHELQRRGHEVAVFSPRLGIPASLMQSNGVWVKSRLNEIPWTPDVIHGHHHLQAMAALSYFGDTPAIFCSHGSSQWAEQVPIHDRIRQYVVMSEGMVPRLGPMYGVSPALVTVVPNFVNTKRFSTVRQAPARLRGRFCSAAPDFRRKSFPGSRPHVRTRACRWTRSVTPMKIRVRGRKHSCQTTIWSSPSDGAP